MNRRLLFFIAAGLMLSSTAPVIAGNTSSIVVAGIAMGLAPHVPNILNRQQNSELFKGYQNSQVIVKMSEKKPGHGFEGSMQLDSYGKPTIIEILAITPGKQHKLAATYSVDGHQACNGMYAEYFSTRIRERVQEHLNVLESESNTKS